MSTLGALGLVVLATLTGGAGTGAASGTALTVLLSEIEGIGSISAGGTVGYAASVENTGTSTVAHVTLVVETAFVNASGGGTYRASQVTGPATCEQGPGTSSITCRAFQLPPGEKFSVRVAFSTPTSSVGDSLRATAAATVSAQTKGSPGNQGTSTWSALPVLTGLTPTSDLSVRTFSLPAESVSAGKSLTAVLGFPSAFSNGHFGLVTAISEFSGVPLCDKCPAVFSNVSIPASLTDKNPFSPSNPYTFTLTLLKSAQPPGYKFNGLVHLEEGSEVWKAVPLCASVTLGPDDPICLDAPPSKDKKTGVITATGRGIENGNMGFD